MLAGEIGFFFYTTCEINNTMHIWSPLFTWNLLIYNACIDTFDLNKTFWNYRHLINFKCMLLQINCITILTFCGNCIFIVCINTVHLY